MSEWISASNIRKICHSASINPSTRPSNFAGTILLAKTEKNKRRKEEKKEERRRGKNKKRKLQV